jgi:hypothetical protein
MVVVMLVIGVSFTLSGSRHGGRSSEQKTITSSTMQHENKNNSDYKNNAASIEEDGEFRAAPDLEEERKSGSGGSHLHDWDYQNDDDSNSGSGSSGGGSSVSSKGIEKELDYSDQDDDIFKRDASSVGAWDTAEKSKPTATRSSTISTRSGGSDDDYYPDLKTAGRLQEQQQQQQQQGGGGGGGTGGGTVNTQQQQQQQTQYDYDADYDTPSNTIHSTTAHTRENGEQGGGVGEEQDNSELVDSRGWAGEDVGAAAEEGFEGDGSFVDSGDVAEMRGEEELEDEDDYAPLSSDDTSGNGGSTGGVGGGDDLEEGEESHYLGRKPDERPLTGGQDWEGDNVAALVNEGEGEDREDRGIHDDNSGGRSTRGGGSTRDDDDYDGEQYGDEEEEEEDAEYGKLLSYYFLLLTMLNCLFIYLLRPPRLMPIIEKKKIEKLIVVMFYSFGLISLSFVLCRL